MSKKNVLNNGYIELVEWLGGDDGVIRNARRCWKSESKGEESDNKLIRHLLKKGHKTPFEAMVFTFDVKCPLFVARQWFRHRIASYNEESLRYCIADRDYFVPEGMEGEPLDAWRAHNEKSFDLYFEMIEKHAVSREVARSLLPVGIYTRFYWTINGSSLMNFLALRADRHAQKEIRQYAYAILDIARPVAPRCFSAFEELILQGGGRF